MDSHSVLLNLSKFESLDIEFSNVVYSVQGGIRGSNKKILKGINGLFKSGEITAIMGPSGAGKSTLLNILTGFKQNKNLKGEINYLINGKEKKTWNMYKKQSCYILQEDQLPNFFTVNELMIMSANFKIDNSLCKNAKQMLIDDILKALDLMQSKNTHTNRLSGGQKKRLSVALELIDNPSVMFLDEPTTGLDSSSSLQCITMLQKLAKKGHTIICTIHQPSANIFEMFNHVYLLSDGQCMYDGAAVNVVDYFHDLGLYCPKYHNPADYMIEVVSNEYGNFEDLLITAVKNNQTWLTNTPSKLMIQNDSQNYKENGKTPVMIKKPSEFTRFFILLNRYFIQFYRDWTIVYLKVFVHFVLGLIFGLFFNSIGNESTKVLNNVGFLMIILIYLTYTNMMPSVLKFPLEIRLLKKEQFNNWYNLKTYYLALLIANLPVQLIFTITVCVISYVLSSQPLDWNRMLMFIGISGLTTLVADSFGLIIGSSINPINGTFVSVIMLCIFVLLSGFFVFFHHMHKYIYYFSYLSYLRYSLDGLIDTIYGYDREKLNCPSLTYCNYRMPQTIFLEFGIVNGAYWYDIIILIINFLFYRILAYYTLKRTLSIT
ncbi:ATP-binding cassette sub-family G member 1-like [Polistes fuscatus]|uniref:ATP-binding cassette sub-family G member 1-like n=1 Tax=Polistes fuscatus TaxID=30207 RepID=UPI001CA878BA|nr:ATP-binding cassette sub-family G member 1-like [Polistes fuscatus]